MAEWLKHGIWQHRGAWALIILGLCLLIIVPPPREYAATALVKLDFVRTNARSLKPLDFATNGSGWRLIRTEASVMRSQSFVRQALERLGFPSDARAVSLAMDRLDWSFVPGGIQLTAVGRYPQETAMLVNAVTEVYRDERNQLWPAPPECRALRITLPKQAQPARCRLNFRPLFRWTLGAASLALAAALLFTQRSPSLLRVLLFWLCLFFGLAVLVTPLSVAVGFAGATLLAFLLAAGVICIARVMSQNPPVPPQLLAYTFTLAFVVLLGQGALVTFVWPEHSFVAARVRVSIEQTGTGGESPTSYEPRFVATECALIRTRPILRQAIDQFSLADTLSRRYGQTVNQRDAEEIVLRTIAARPVQDTSMVDIMYWDQAGRGQEQIAAGIAAIYRRYWEERSQTNLAQRIKVVLLGSPDSPRSEAQRMAGRCGLVMTARLLSALLVLAGALCAAWLAKNPVRLWFLLASAIFYLGWLGIFAVASSLTLPTYAATCLVRIWPLAAAAPRHRSHSTEAWIRRECELASSPKVLAKIVPALDANPNFMKQPQGSWRAMSTSERQLWLHRHLKVIPGADTFLMWFKALADNPDDAAEVANTAAGAFCSNQAASASAIEGRGRLDIEILDKAVPALRPQEESNPLEIGLMNSLDYVIYFFIGAGIGCLGFLVETARRARAADPTKGAPPLAGRRWQR